MSTMIDTEIRVGTIVAVVKKDCAFGWNSEMDEAIGTFDVVKHMGKSDNGSMRPYVKLEGCNGYWFPYGSIKAVCPGMRVKAINKSKSDIDVVGQVGTVIDCPVEEGFIPVRFDNECGWNTMPYKNVVYLGMEEERESKTSGIAKILTKKVVVKMDDSTYTKCREILGFENIMTMDQLPREYVSSGEYFVMSSTRVIYKHVFDSKGDYSPVSNDGKCIDFHMKVENFPYSTVRTGDVIPEDVFQKIVEKMKECGTRLMEIRKAEKIKKEWSGEEVVEI